MFMGLTIRWKGLGRISAFSEGNFLTGFYNLINAVGLALPSPSARSFGGESDHEDNHEKGYPMIHLKQPQLPMNEAINTVWMSLQRRIPMNIEIKDRFMAAWEKYFPGSELPIVCFYSNELGDVEFPNRPKPNNKGYTCVFSQIAPVKQGRPRAFNMENLGCFGSFLPFGFDIDISEDVKNYICNIERVKKSYDHVESIYKHRPP